MTRRLTNQDAFDGAMLHLLNQGRSCLSANGQARYRGPRGKSAIGALIPDALYITSMEGKNLRHWLAARGSEYDGLRERFGGVTASLLDDLQDLHDRSGSCMPSLYRHLVLAGAQRIAQSFKLSMRLVTRGATYQHLKGPHVFAPIRRAIPVTAPVVELTAAPVVEVAATPVIDVPAPAVPPAGPAVDATVSPANGVSAIPTTDVPTTSANGAPAAAAAEAPAAPELAAAPAPTPAPVPTPLAESPQDELDLIARGIAKAIAAASAPNLNQRPGRQ